MLTLLSPAALWSLAALALPLALHLWRQPPRTVRLPSLRFLQAHAGRRLHDLHWRERRLLLARLGLLALLAGLLARPWWQRLPPHGPQRWILLDPAAAPNASGLTRLRALQAAGYATHLLAPGLPTTAQLPADLRAAVPDLWSLLREADAALPAGSTLAIFSPGRAASLRGNRPGLRSKVEWINTPDLAGDLPHIWISSLRPAGTPGQPPAVTFGVSDALATRFLASPPVGWKQETRPDAARLLAPNGNLTPWTPVPKTTPLSVLILHDAARSEDARYLAAALRAATQTGGRTLDLRSAPATDEAATLPAANWTFWLAAATPSAQIEQRHTVLFQDAPQADLMSPDWIVPQPGTPGAAVLQPSVRLWGRGVPPAGHTVWTDAHGSPLLAFTERTQGVRWSFANRFHPDWSDLPRTTAFPAWLQSLLLDAPPSHDSDDGRLADATQAQPSNAVPTSSLSVLPPANASSQDLHWLVWTLAAFFFCLERFLSQRRPRAPARMPAISPPEPVAVR